MSSIAFVSTPSPFLYHTLFDPALFNVVFFPSLPVIALSTWLLTFGYWLLALGSHSLLALGTWLLFDRISLRLALGSSPPL